MNLSTIIDVNVVTQDMLYVLIEQDINKLTKIVTSGFRTQQFSHMTE